MFYGIILSGVSEIIFSENSMGFSDLLGVSSGCLTEGAGYPTFSDFSHLNYDTELVSDLVKFFGLQSRIFPGGVAVDLFCGTGFWANRLRDAGFANVSAVDKNVRLGSSLSSGIKFIPEDIEVLVKYIVSGIPINAEVNVDFQSKLGKMRNSCCLVIDFFGTTSNYGYFFKSGFGRKALAQYLLCPGGIYANECFEFWYKDPITNKVIEVDYNFLKVMLEGIADI